MKRAKFSFLAPSLIMWSQEIHLLSPNFSFFGCNITLTGNDVSLGPCVWKWETVFKVLLVGPASVVLCKGFHIFQLRSQQSAALSWHVRKWHPCEVTCARAISCGVLLLTTWKSWHSDTSSLQSSLLPWKTRILKVLLDRYREPLHYRTVALF